MTTTHPYPQLIDPRTWCLWCESHVAEIDLCPGCLEDLARARAGGGGAPTHTTLMTPSPGHQLSADH